MLEKRGVEIPAGQWLALSDPFTADPEYFRRAGYRPRSSNKDGNGRRSDKVLQIVQVMAALALEIAVTDEHLGVEDSADEICKKLAKAGLLAPGAHVKGYSTSAVKDWRQHCNRGSHKLTLLYAYGRKIFHNLKWREVLQLACVEANLRAALHELHKEDPDGTKAHSWFHEYLQQLREEHDRVQRDAE
jgi:hypothetical protein